jgi:hypothetical protein
MVVTMKMMVFWDMTMCSLKDECHFYQATKHQIPEDSNRTNVNLFNVRAWRPCLPLISFHTRIILLLQKANWL